MIHFERDLHGYLPGWKTRLYKGHWPVADRFMAWLYDFGLLHDDEKDFPHLTKRWRGLWVDRELKDEWLDRMNDIPCVAIVLTCAGHKKENDWTQSAIVRFTVPCDPRAAIHGPGFDLESLSREVQDRFGDVAKIEVFTFGDNPGEDLIFIDLISKSRKEMPDSYFTQWWETILSGMEEFGLDEAKRFGEDNKAVSLPDERVPPFMAIWHLISPKMQRLHKGQSGPYDTHEEALEAAYQGAFSAGAHKVAPSRSDYIEILARMAFAGQPVDVFDGTIEVVDAYDRNAIPQDMVQNGDEWVYREL